MNVILLILMNIIVLTFPYAVIFIILSYYSWRHGLTLKALMAKYSEAKGLFGVMLDYQLASLVIVALAGVFAVFIYQGPTVTLTSMLPGAILSVIVLESGFLVTLIDYDIDEALDYISKDLHNLHNQSIKI